MKAYLATSHQFRIDHKEDYDILVSTMNKNFGDGNVFYATSKIDVEVETSDEKSILGAVHARQKALKDADVLVAEITESAAGTGYDIHTAVSLKKPVLVLRRKDEGRKLVHHPITAGESKLLKYKEYKTIAEAEKYIQEFRDEAASMLDTKFILIISPEIDRYLEWAADYRRMHKAQIVRNAVEKKMGNDEEYNSQ